MGKLCVLLLLLLSASAVHAAEAVRGTAVYFAEIEGIVGVPMEEHVRNVFLEAGNDPDTLLVFRINTPGGLVDSMSEIMMCIAEANYPVVLWVAPSGARAASAGAFIVQAAHLAAMAPSTNIGAAHPVTGAGEDIEKKGKEMDRKVVNDLTAKMRSFTQERGRNVKVAESMVSESVSLSSQEALGKRVIDFIAADEDELLNKLKGRTVRVKGAERTISLDGHHTKRIEMTPRLRLLGFLSRPDIAYMALIAGIFLIILEARAPGGFVMGTSGALLLVMASYGLRVLPVNMAGLALLVAGIIVMAVDLITGGIGILLSIGIGALLFGGLILFKAPGGELLHLSAGFVVGVTIVIAVAFLLVLRLVYKALRKRPASGEEALIGERVTILGFSGKGPMVMAHGEYWRVKPQNASLTLSEGDEVEIVRVEALTLYVKLVNSLEVKNETEDANNG